MNREDIIRMARDAGFGVLLPSGDGGGEIYAAADVYTDEMERFAALVAAAEREACARVCDALASPVHWMTAQACAEAIRERGGKA